MWILTFLPNLLVHIIFLTGLVLFLTATFLGMIPIINRYKTIGQLVGVVIIVFGIYLEGGLAYKEKQAAMVDELEKKLLEISVIAEKKNVEIVTKVVTDTKIIRQKGDDVVSYIDREIVKYNDNCSITPEVVTAHNLASSLETIVPEKSTNISLPVRTSK